MSPRFSNRAVVIAQVAMLSVVLGVAIALALRVNGYYVFVLANVALLALVGAGMNVLIGLSGQISFGHVGFYALGAYTVAVLGKAGVSFWIAWPAGAALATLFGGLLALPALRVKGPYLAMVTIAFGFIVEHAIVEARGLTGGQNGIMGIVSPTLGALRGERAVAVLALLSAGVACIGYMLVARGQWGAALRAVRGSEIAAESIGLNPLVIKTVAFAVSAFTAGAAGGLFASLSGFVTPNTFGFSQSILFVLAVMIGGAGSAAGPLVGAVIVGLLPEVLSSLEDFRLLFFGGLLLLVLWVAPGGLVGLAQAALRALQMRFGSSKPAATVSPVEPVSPFAPRTRAGLCVSGLSIRFGGVQAVSELSFDAAAGQVTSLIGPNGAGKTTALNMLSGFYAPSSGDFSLGGMKLGGRSAMRVARAGIARTYQTSQLFGALSVIDNVALALTRGKLGFLFGRARLHASGVRSQAAALLAFSGYRGDHDASAEDLPHVDRRFVEIARAMALDPDVLLLDEPAAGLSTDDKERLGRILRKIADTGVAIVVVEHDMALVMGVSDAIVVLDQGRRLAVGSPVEIQANVAVRHAYLGEGAATAQPRSRAAKTGAPELLGVNGLVVGYGAEPILHGIDLQVRRGEVVALLGANGAGKSTLMRTLSGLHRPVSAGGVTLDGQDVSTLGAESMVALGMALSPEGRQVFPELSVLDNIRLGGFLAPQGRDARVEDMLTRFPRLRERLHQRAGLLSGGEQQMLAVARALMSRPRILLLDEPSLGLAPKVVADLFAALDRLREEDMTILVVDQMAALALALADRAYVLERGRIVAQGMASDIAQDPALAQAYLGA
ncbi:MAG: transporter [Hyphomicrobiales bacterium]|nr:transporter [Hyphomicrobiales bacterium]